MQKYSGLYRLWPKPVIPAGYFLQARTNLDLLIAISSPSMLLNAPLINLALTSHDGFSITSVLASISAISTEDLLAAKPLPQSVRTIPGADILLKFNSLCMTPSRILPSGNMRFYTVSETIGVRVTMPLRGLATRTVRHFQ